MFFYAKISVLQESVKCGSSRKWVPKNIKLQGFFIKNKGNKITVLIDIEDYKGLRKATAHKIEVNPIF